jgi:DNA primase catalytic subunit
MPKQNVSANTKRRRVTFAKKISRKLLIEEVATRALAASSLTPQVKKTLKGILKKSSYKKKKKATKDVSSKKKSVRYVLDQ